MKQAVRFSISDHNNSLQQYYGSQVFDLPILSPFPPPSPPPSPPSPFFPLQFFVITIGLNCCQIVSPTIEGGFHRQKRQVRGVKNENHFLWTIMWLMLLLSSVMGPRCDKFVKGTVVTNISSSTRYFISSLTIVPRLASVHKN